MWPAPLNITKANASARVLTLEIDGRFAFVEEPKLTLLKDCVVILLDTEGHWENTLSESYEVDGRWVQLRGATRDLKLAFLVRRFVDGEKGDLLAADAALERFHRERFRLSGEFMKQHHRGPNGDELDEICRVAGENTGLPRPEPKPLVPDEDGELL